MRTLSSISQVNEFYQCKEWIDLMRSIRLERGNVCEFCGRPIVNAYDSIGHHKIELNSRNYKDINVSLNPDNIMLVHLSCHNKIHNKLGNKPRSVYIVYGSPCGGKTTYVKENAEIGDLIVDMDDIWQCISRCDRYTHPNELKSNAFEVRNVLLDNIKFRVGNWSTAWVIGGYSLVGERERLANQLGARLIFIDTSKEECISRLECNPAGRNISEWRKYIEDWWEKFSRCPPTSS